MKEIEKVFNEYVNNYDLTDYNTNYKFKHSYRVEKLSRMIAKSLGLNDEDIYLATVIGLLHDIGRFEQIKRFNSFSDSNIDHADLGIEILFQEELIEDFNIDSKYYDIIRFAIENHNKLEIEKESDERKIMFAKIIRDADKIDILRYFVINKDYKLKEDDSELSVEVIKQFKNNVSVDYKNINSLNDKIVLILSFVFDINFANSYNIIISDRLIEKFYESLIHKELFKPYFDIALNYLKSKGELIC